MRRACGVGFELQNVRFVSSRISPRGNCAQKNDSLGSGCLECMLLPYTAHDAAPTPPLGQTLCQFRLFWETPSHVSHGIAIFRSLMAT